MSKQFIIGIFDDEENLVKAATELKLNGHKIHDFYTPFPVHGLDEILEITRSRLPQVTFVAGIIGLILAISFQVWTSAVAWPINVGGKPMLSIPAFIPITFEIMILLGALTTVAAFLFKSDLYPTKEVKLMELRQTDDEFLIAINCNNTPNEFEKMNVILKNNGAKLIRYQD